MRLTDFADADVVLLGLGVETLTVLTHLQNAGVARIRMVETATPRPDQAAALEAGGIDPHGLLATPPNSADVVLRSPGVPAHSEDVARLADTAHVATTPTGLWLALRGGSHTVVVTGTKGKSSTATLIAQGLEHGGVSATLVGNIGTSAWSVDPHIDGVVVAELSSYQGADLIATCEVAVLTMLADDHLDWHGSAAAYRHDKLRILTVGQADGTPSATVLAPAEVELPTDVDAVVTRVASAGDYQARNVALAVAATCAELALRGRSEVPDTDELMGFLTDAYPRLPSRFEPVDTTGEIAWIDDALASNPSATAAALERLAPGPAVLICGGHDRGVLLDPVVAQLDQWPTGSLGVVWLGPRTDERFVLLCQHHAVGQAATADSMHEAVKTAAAYATGDSTVVFSPLAPTERSQGVWTDRSRAFRDAIAKVTADSPRP